MRVAVTGIASDFGTVIAPLLFDDPEIEQVIGIDLREPSASDSKLSFEREDVRSPRLAELFADCEAVIHLAFVVDEIHDKDETHSINLGGSKNVIASALAAGAERLVIASSVASYGTHSDHEIPITEDQFPRGNPDKYYFYDKAEVEHYIEWWLARNPDASMAITRIRPPIIVGPAFTKDFMGRLFGRSLVLPDSSKKFQFLWQSDLAQAFYLAAKRPSPGAFNVGTDDWIGVRELADVHGQRLRRIPHRVAKTAADALFKLRMSQVSSAWVTTGEPIVSPAKARRELGWQPRFTTAEAARIALIQRGRPIMPGQSGDVFALKHVAEEALAPITERLRDWATAVPGLCSALDSSSDIDRFAERVEHASIGYRDLALHLELHAADNEGVPTLVFSPGMGAYARFYLPLLGKLCDSGFNVVAIDRPGHGLSEGRRGEGSMDQILDVVEATVRFARGRFGGPVALVGSSLGGIIDWYALTREPDVEAVVCHNIARPDVLPDLAARLKVPGIRKLARIAPRARVPIKQMADFGKVSRDPLILDYVDRQLDQIWCWNLSAGFAASMFDYRPPLDWRAVRTPALVMVGAEDEMVTAEYTRKVLAAGTPLATEVEIIPGMGHMLFFDHLDEALPKLVGWLERTLAGSPRAVETAT